MIATAWSKLNERFLDIAFIYFENSLKQQLLRIGILEP